MKNWVCAYFFLRRKTPDKNIAIEGGERESTPLLLSLPEGNNLKEESETQGRGNSGRRFSGPESECQVDFEGERGRKAKKRVLHQGL